MNRLGIRTLSLVMLTFGGIWASCSVYNDKLLVKTDASLSSGGSSGSGGAGGVNEECNRATFPVPPGTGLGGNIEFVAAMQTIDFGEVILGLDGYSTQRPIGYDLDLMCGPSCTAAWINVDPAAALDDSEGRDNALGKLIGKIQSTWVKRFGSQAYNEQIAQGLVSVLFRVKGYNGEANDDQVTSILYQPAPMADAIQFDNRTTPQWDGNDVWPITSDSVTNSNPDTPLFQDTNAYVNNGVLVASMPTAQFRVSTGITQYVTVEMMLHFVHSFLTADLVKGENGGWELHNGQIVGRWPVDDLVHQLSQFPDTSDSTLTKPLCINLTTYPTFRDVICSFVDINATGIDPKCDSISVGIGFEARPARLGDIWTLNPLKSRCPAATDPGNDSCATPISGVGGTSGSDGGSGTSGSGGTATGGSSSGGTSGIGGASGTGGQSSGGTGGVTDASGQ